MADRPESLAAALAELQQHLPRIGKDAQGQRSRYASLEQVNGALLPLLGERGFSFICTPTLGAPGRDHGDYQFGLLYVLRWSGSDEKIEGFYPLPSSTPQTMGGAITYARRYCLLAVTGAAPDEEDDDAQAAEQAARYLPKRDEQAVANVLLEEQQARAQRNHPPETRPDGSATEAEQARMRDGSEPGTWHSTGTAENDGWYDEPGQPLDPPAETAFGSASGQQKTRMFALFGGLKMRQREKQIAFIKEVIGETVNSRNDLSYVQAGQVLEALEQRSGASVDTN